MDKSDLDQIKAAVTEPLRDLAVDMGIIKEKTTDMEEHLKDLNHSVSKNTRYRIRHSGETKIIYAVIGSAFSVLILFGGWALTRFFS